MIVLLIKNDLRKLDQIIIDREYIGYEKMIKQFIIEICQKHRLKLDPTIISFRNIGKRSKAHGVSVRAFRKKRADLKVTVQDFLKITFL